MEYLDNLREYAAMFAANAEHWERLGNDAMANLARSNQYEVEQRIRRWERS